MVNRSRNVAVIGLGTFGVSVALELTRMGDTVLGIDSDEASVMRLNGDVASTLQADATDSKALAECGLDAYDAIIISIGENVEASILTAMNVMELGCPTVWVKAQTETQRKILEAIGVHHVVLPEHAYGTSIAQIIHNPIVKDFLSFGDGNYLIEMDVTKLPAKSNFIDPKHLAAQHITCVGVYTDGKLVPSESIDGPLVKGATVLLFGKRADLRKFADAL